MAQSISLSGAVHVFSCPRCNETINTSMTECAFCHAPVDSRAAATAAEAMSRISQACSDASYLTVMGGTYLAFLVVLIIPFLGLLGVVGIWFLSFAIPFMVGRWWIKFGGIETADLDYRAARSRARWIGIMGVVLFFGRITFHFM